VRRGHSCPRRSALLERDAAGEQTGGVLLVSKWTGFIAELYDSPVMTLGRNTFVTCAIFAFFYVTSWAKCPSNFVKIHGKIRCTVNPGDKILVSLIFAEHQLEGSAPETALDVQDRAFTGEVIFSTNGRNRIEKCNVRPKAVLVRLISAKGSEQDRTLLKISDAFKYDSELGEYTPRADITLSGWCDPSKDDAPCPK